MEFFIIFLHLLAITDALVTLIGTKNTRLKVEGNFLTKLLFNSSSCYSLQIDKPITYTYCSLINKDIVKHASVLDEDDRRTWRIYLPPHPVIFDALLSKGLKCNIVIDDEVFGFDMFYTNGNESLRPPLKLDTNNFIKRYAEMSPNKQIGYISLAVSTGIILLVGIISLMTHKWRRF